MEVCLRAFKLAGICNLCIAALRSNKVFCDRNVVRHPTCLEIVENFAQFVIDDLAKKQARKETRGKSASVRIAWSRRNKRQRGQP